jgi:hypothetical protein
MSDLYHAKYLKYKKKYLAMKGGRHCESGSSNTCVDLKSLFNEYVKQYNISKKNMAFKLNIVDKNTASGKLVHDYYNNEISNIDKFINSTLSTNHTIDSIDSNNAAIESMVYAISQFQRMNDNLQKTLQKKIAEYFIQSQPKTIMSKVSDYFKNMFGGGEYSCVDAPLVVIEYMKKNDIIPIIEHLVKQYNRDDMNTIIDDYKQKLLDMKRSILYDMTWTERDSGKVMRLCQPDNIDTNIWIIKWTEGAMSTYKKLSDELLKIVYDKLNIK